MIILNHFNIIFELVSTIEKHTKHISILEKNMVACKHYLKFVS